MHVQLVKCHTLRTPRSGIWHTKLKSYDLYRKNTVRTVKTYCTKLKRLWSLPCLNTICSIKKSQQIHAVYIYSSVVFFQFTKTITHYRRAGVYSYELLLEINDLWLSCLLKKKMLESKLASKLSTYVYLCTTWWLSVEQRIAYIRNYPFLTQA